MYGAQTLFAVIILDRVFENDVEMYGAQTYNRKVGSIMKFENDVEMYGAQTGDVSAIAERSLRMM